MAQPRGSRLHETSTQNGGDNASQSVRFHHLLVLGWEDSFFFFFFGKILNICLSNSHLVRSCLQFSSSAGYLYNSSKNNILRKHIIYFEVSK